MYGMSLLHNFDRYDEKSFTDRQRIFDYILFSSQMYKETRMIFFRKYTPHLYSTVYRQYGLRAPICMVCLFSTTIRDMMKIPLQIDRDYSITYYFRLKCIRRHE